MTPTEGAVVDGSRLSLELAGMAWTPPPRPASDFLAGPGIPGLVSVIIPTYNRAGILPAAIESALEQSHTGVEVIVVDDGSTDDTRATVERYGARVRYLFQANSGVSAARNLGFAHARGEFVALLDSDDRYVPWKLEAQVRVLRQHPEAGMVWTDMMAVNAAGNVFNEAYLRVFYSAHAAAQLEQRMDSPESLGQLWAGAPASAAAARIFVGDIFSPMLLGNLVHTSTVLIRRDRLRLVGGFDTSLTESGEDYEFHLRTSSHGPVAFIDASTLLYRVGAADQLTAPQFGIYAARNNLTTILRWFALGQSRIELPEHLVRHRLAQAFRWVGEVELERGNRIVARKHLWTSLRFVPAQRRAALMLAATALPVSARRAARVVKRAVHLFAHIGLFGMCVLGIALGCATPRSSLITGAASRTARTVMLTRRCLRRPNRLRRGAAVRSASVATPPLVQELTLARASRMQPSIRAIGCSRSGGFVTRRVARPTTRRGSGMSALRRCPCGEAVPRASPKRQAPLLGPTPVERRVFHDTTLGAAVE